MLDHGYYPDKIQAALEAVYPEMMTKIQFELSAKPSKAEKAAQELAKAQDDTIHALQELFKNQILYTTKEQIVNDLAGMLSVPTSDSVSVMVKSCNDGSTLADFHDYLHKVLNEKIAEYMVDLSADPKGEYHSVNHQRNSIKSHLKVAKVEACGNLQTKLDYAIFLREKAYPYPQQEATNE
jgi:hypothetical protein